MRKTNPKFNEWVVMEVRDLEGNVIFNKKMLIDGISVYKSNNGIVYTEYSISDGDDYTSFKKVSKPGSYIQEPGLIIESGNQELG
jgi:hypothetical protein